MFFQEKVDASMGAGTKVTSYALTLEIPDGFDARFFRNDNGVHSLATAVGTNQNSGMRRGKRDYTGNVAHDSYIGTATDQGFCGGYAGGHAQIDTLHVSTGFLEPAVLQGKNLGSVLDFCRVGEPTHCTVSPNSPGTDKNEGTKHEQEQ